jgi:hypothetical protein
MTLTIVLISQHLSYKNSNNFLTAAQNRHETTRAGIAPPLFSNGLVNGIGFME